jgi:hypothetical protein
LKCIVCPKEYKDGTVRWILSCTTDEPANLEAALDHKEWNAAMHEEYDACPHEKSYLEIGSSTTRYGYY